jgi:putative membrane protein PagO
MSASSRVAAAYTVLCLLPSTSWVAIKIGLDGTGPLTGAGLRFLIAGACLMAVRLVTGRSLRFPRAAARELSAVAVLMFAIPYACIYWAETRITSGLAAVLFGATPLFVVVIADRARTREPLTAASGAGVALGFAGLVVAFSHSLEVGGGGRAALASAAVLLAALLTAAMQVRARGPARSFPLSSLIAWAALGAGVLLTVAGLATEADQLDIGAGTLAASAYLGLTAAAGFWSMFWLLGRIGAVWVSLHALVVPLLALGWGALLEHERASYSALVGACAVSAGIALNGFDALRRGRLRRSTARRATEEVATSGPA